MCVFIDENGGLRNGFYGRKMKTRFGEIDDLTVPSDKEGIFRFVAYPTVAWVFSLGTSTRDLVSLL